MPEPRELPAPAIVADLCAQEAWKQENENTRRVLESAAETIRAVIRRCIALAHKVEIHEAEDQEPEESISSTIAWEFDIAEGDVMVGPCAALAELNNEDPQRPDFDPDLGPFRTLTVPMVAWYGNDADAVEVRAFGKWLVQMADWLEGAR
ncbi:MAG: hypothetical protein EBR82_63035 [Caulobacteraceae bacterium]|nr:hypothetical protein [Caulobacteraceae bacterium]